MNNLGMKEISPERSVKEMWWDDDDLYVTFSDGNKETICFKNAYMINQTTIYPNQDSLVVEDCVCKMETVI